MALSATNLALMSELWTKELLKNVGEEIKSKVPFQIAFYIVVGWPWVAARCVINTILATNKRHSAIRAVMGKLTPSQPDPIRKEDKLNWRSKIAQAVCQDICA